MKNLIYILFSLFLSNTVKGQDYGRNLGAVSVIYNHQSGKTFKYSDEQVEVSIPKESISELIVQLRNVTNVPLYFNWSESYFLINEEMISINDNAKESAIAFGLAIKEVNSLPPNTKIVPSSKVELRIGSKKGMFWDYRDANNYFKEHGKPREDRLVLVFENGDKKLEKSIAIQVYTGKIIKQLKK